MEFGKKQKTFTGEVVKMVCPYNNFKECFKEECPFYYKSGVTRYDGKCYEYCARAEREKREK